MPISRLTQYLPPELVYVREPLAEEENALGPFEEMLEHAAIPDRSDEGFCHLVYGDLDGEAESGFPEGAEGERIRGILAENAKAFELMDQGLDRGRLQLPEPVWGADEGDSLGDSEFRGIAEVRTVRGDALLADGDFAGAAADYRAVYRLGTLIANREGISVHILGTRFQRNEPGGHSRFKRGWDYLERGSHHTGPVGIKPRHHLLTFLGTGLQRKGLGGMCRLVSRAEVSRAVLRDLKEFLGGERVDKAAVQTNLAIELGYLTLDRLETMPDGGTLESIVDALLREYYSDRPQSWGVAESEGTVAERSPEQIADLDRRLRWRREKILFLLEGHSHPFDKIATVRLMGEYLKRLLDHVEKAFAGDCEELRSRDAEESREMQVWPTHLAPEWPCSIVGETSPTSWDGIIYESASGWDFGPNSDAPLPPAPTDEELEAARETLRQVDNPIGKLVALPMLDSSPAYLIALYLHGRYETEQLLAKRLG